MLGHVSKIRNIGIVMREYRARERLDLAESDGLPSEVVPRHARSLDAAAHAQVSPRCHSFRALTA